MTPQTQAPSSFLGISTKSVHTARNQRVTDEKAAEACRAAKERRFELQREAQGILYDPEKQPGDQRRVVWCYRNVRTRGENLPVWRTENGAGARISGLWVCGDVWACPVCAAKVTEARRKELTQTVARWRGDQERNVGFLTLTFSHHAMENGEPTTIGDVLPKFMKALQRFKNSRTYKAVFADAEREGSIKSLETTWGKNGWHPHVHEIVLTQRDLTNREVDQLADAWVDAVIKSKLSPENKRSLMLQSAADAGRKRRGCTALTWQDGQYAAEYAAKFGSDSAWDISAEMTSPHSKLGRAGEYGGEDHFTPFQLLAWAADGDQLARKLFREFAEAFKGKRMLTYSPGIRSKSDQEIAAAQDPAPDERQVGVVTTDQYALILSRNYLGKFHRYVAKNCWNPETAQALIDEYVEFTVKGRKRTHSGMYLKKPFMGRGGNQLLREAA